MSKYIANATKHADLEKNVQFQLDNVLGWVSIKDYESALIKARCLVNELENLVKLEKSSA